MNTILIVVFLGILYFLAHVFASFFSRSKIPDVLWLMIIGLLLGPIFGVVDTSGIGEVGPVFVTVTLVVILFQGGLGIRFKTFANAWPRGLALSIATFVAIVITTGIAATVLTGLTPLNAFMLGAIIGGTSSAIVIPMVHQLRMSSESKTVLILESALTDVLCIVVALALMDVQLGNSHNLGLTIGSIIASFFIAIILGVLVAIVWSVALGRIRTLQNSIFATPAFVFIIFGATELLGFSGYMAALAFGITIGNIEILQGFLSKTKFLNHSVRPSSLNDIEKSFFSEIVFLLKTFFFVYIGLSIKINDAWLIYVGIILSVLYFIIRIPVVRFSISRNTLKEDASLMAVMVPIGLAAAALASLPLQLGIAGGEIIQNVTFAVVFVTITFTSILVWLVHETPFAKLYYRLFYGFGPPPSPETKIPGQD